MTVQTELNRKQYTGNGVTTSFATSPIVFFDTSDLVVYVVTTATGASTTLTENTHYTVSGGDGSTGTVSLAGGSSPYGAPSASQTVVIVRDVPLTQAVDFVQNDASDAEVVEDALDKLTMGLQQVATQVSRSLRLNDADVSGADAALPTPSANKLIGWNSGATALENKTAADIDLATVTAFVETFLDDADAATARATLGAIGNAIIDAKGDLIYGAAADTPAVLANGIEMIGAAPGGRLTLTSGTPVTTGDVTGATTVYYTPHQGNVVSLYDGDTWIPYIFSELSQATSDTSKSPAAVANNSNYDIFVWNDAGTLRATRGPLWTSDTARGTGAGTTELELFEGRYVNKVAITNGPAARRGVYVGSVRSNGSSQIDDTTAGRHVWNMYNRVTRASNVSISGYWTYQSATIRQANATASNKVCILIGLSEDVVIAHGRLVCNVAATGHYSLGWGLDSTSSIVGDASYTDGISTGNWQEAVAHYVGYPGVGYHYLSLNEYANSTVAANAGSPANSMQQYVWIRG